MIWLIIGSNKIGLVGQKKIGLEEYTAKRESSSIILNVIFYEVFFFQTCLI